MKGLAGGLIHNSKAAMAYMTQFDNVLPIWGIQKISELEEWLSYMENTPSMDEKIENCLECGQCIKKCPYELNTPELLKKNYEDYKKVLAGEVSVN